MNIKTIDENTGNPFPEQSKLITQAGSGFSHVSSEGYYHNDEQIAETTKKLIELLGIPNGATTIDIGYGSNKTVAKTLAELGMDSLGLDSQDGLNKEKQGNPFINPPKFIKKEDGADFYCGMIEDINHSESELRLTPLDLALFWGSWNSGGNNFAIVGEYGEFRYRNLHPDADELATVIQGVYNQQLEMLQNVTEHLPEEAGKDAGLLFISSRYARHGAGYATDQLPEEKKGMLRLANNLKRMGAQQATFLGASKESIDTQLSGHAEFQETRNILLDNTLLVNAKNNVYDPVLTTEENQALIAMDIPLGRIDAMYLQF